VAAEATRSAATRDAAARERRAAAAPKATSMVSKAIADGNVQAINYFVAQKYVEALKEFAHSPNQKLFILPTDVTGVIGSMDLDESLSKRDEINSRLLTVVDQATHPWGIKVNRIELKDIQPPRDLVDSMARQMKAEREKRAQILEAEGARASEILKSEGEKQGLILQAEGRREAAFRDAEARERLAEAEARATTMVSEAVAKGDVQALNYFVAQRYTQALEAIASAPGQRVLMLPIEASALIGSLAGITELAKASFGEEATARRSGRVPPAGTGGTS
jgi:regulator of protease activity HflC (stomatin/prohibitin superfamily)